MNTIITYPNECIIYHFILQEQLTTHAISLW